MLQRRILSLTLLVGALIAIGSAASAATGGAPPVRQVAGHLVAARPTLPAGRLHQLDAFEAAVDQAAPTTQAALDPIARRILGPASPAQLTSFEAMGLANIAEHTRAHVVADAHALADADAGDRRAALVSQISSAKQAGQSTTTLDGQLDAMSDMTEQLQLELPMAQQAYTQVMEMLSNVLKAMSSTADGIVQNLK